MLLKSKRAVSLFMACVLLFSILGSAAEAAVAILLSPKPGETSGKTVEVSVKYDSQSSVKIDSAVLYIDNTIYEKKYLKAAKTGIVTFDWKTGNFAKGQHYIEVRLFSNNKLVTAVNGYGVVSDYVYDVNPPKVSLANVKNGETVSGIKLLQIQAKDDSGEAPIVSLLVDKKLKLMQNTQPYAYTLNTEEMSDGKHQIEIYAFDLEGNQSDIMTYTINVQNGGSKTVTASAGTVTVNPAVINDPSLKADAALASRPALSTSNMTGVGRISENEVSASITETKSAKVLVSPDAKGVFDATLSKPAVNTANINTPKTAPVQTKNDNLTLNKKAVSSEVKNTPEVKKISADSLPVFVAKNGYGTDTESFFRFDKSVKSAKAELDTPSVKSVKVNAQAVKETEVLVAKNDTAKPNESLKLSAPAKTSVSLDTPNVKKEIKTETKTDVSLLVAKNSNTGIAVQSEYKFAANVKQTLTDLNTPNIKNTAVAGKPVLKAQAASKTVKPVKEVTASNNAVVKGKLRDAVNDAKGTLFWDNKTKTVTAYVNNVKVVMKIGSKNVKVNGNPVVVNLIPQIKNGRTIIDVTEFKKIVSEAKTEK